jgi:hypothetical protein
MNAVISSARIPHIAYLVVPQSVSTSGLSMPDMRRIGMADSGRESPNSPSERHWSRTTPTRAGSTACQQASTEVGNRSALAHRES